MFPIVFRSILAVVGPFGSGKSALVNLIGGRLRASAKVSGSMSINGKGVKESWVRPTCLGMRDDPLANVTVEQALVYTGKRDQALFLPWISEYSAATFWSWVFLPVSRMSSASLQKCFSQMFLNVRAHMALFGGLVLILSWIVVALLQMPDTGNGELEEEVRQICLKLGLMGDLQKSTSETPLTNQYSLNPA